MSRTASRSRGPTSSDISVRPAGPQIGSVSGATRGPTSALPVFAILARTSSQRAISFTVRSCSARTRASPSSAFLRAPAMTAIVASICSSTVDGAAASPALARVAAHAARMVSICWTRCCASVARLVSLSLSATSLERIACHASARLASALAECDDTSVSVVFTERLSIQSAAPVSSSSASRNSEPSGACAERSSVVACSARWAISGIGIGVIVLAGPCASWAAVAAGPPAGCADAARADPSRASAASARAVETSARARTPRGPLTAIPTHRSIWLTRESPPAGGPANHPRNRATFREARTSSC